jgi:hypothetical protein
MLPRSSGYLPDESCRRWSKRVPLKHYRLPPSLRDITSQKITICRFLRCAYSNIFPLSLEEFIVGLYTFIWSICAYRIILVMLNHVPYMQTPELVYKEGWTIPESFRLNLHNSLASSWVLIMLCVYSVVHLHIQHSIHSPIHTSTVHAFFSINLYRPILFLSSSLVYKAFWTK